MYLSKITPLWVANHFVDIIQDTKVALVKDLVPHETLKKTIFEFIERQRDYTKTMNRISVELLEQSVLYVNPFLK